MENTDVFSNVSSGEVSFVKEFYARNERKKDDEKWLKENKAKIREILGSSPAKDFEGIRVKISVPNVGKFNLEKVKQFLIDHNLQEEGCKIVADEDKVEALIGDGSIVLDELKEYAWEDAEGTPRILVTSVI